MGAEIPDGAVLVARAILNSSIWTMRAADKIVAITCICLANWKPRSWFNGVESMTIGRGQFVRSWDHLAEACQLSVQSVRTSVKNLEKVGFLTRKLTGHVQLFTIPKYSHYQDLTKYSDQIAAESNKVPNSPLTATQQQPNSALTTNKKGIREECKKGEEGPRESVRAMAAKWNRGPGLHLDGAAACQQIQAAVDVGVSLQDIDVKFSDDEAIKGLKIWEVLDPMRPASKALVFTARRDANGPPKV